MYNALYALRKVVKRYAYKHKEDSCSFLSPLMDILC